MEGMQCSYVLIELTGFRCSGCMTGYVFSLLRLPLEIMLNPHNTESHGLPSPS